ncbi:hypothetical protein [Dysgonomonas termitidis]|uniref:SD-repeat containing protein B domain-containing protein n=1 Tax=Dysgonomonas termitidis TaxID=1516126 RepID=A0ABV9KTJ0_9BACT
MTNQNNKTTYTVFKISLLTLLCTVCSFSSVLHAQDALTVKWGDGTIWTNVDSLPTPHQAEMNNKSGNVQMQITADFALPGSVKTREIMVDIPRGYMIKEYSVKSGTDAIDGVTQLSLPGDRQSMIASSLLTARDGTPFADQVITGYTTYRDRSPYNTNTKEENIRPYDGKVVYTFNSNCDRIVLTLTLAIDMPLVPHTDPALATGSIEVSYDATLFTSHTLPDITVDMISGTSELSNHVKAHISQLVIPYIATTSISGANNGHSGKVEGVVDSTDPNKGTADFNTGWTFSSYNSGMGLETPYVDEVVITIPYREGVTYKGFNISRVWLLNPGTSTEGSFNNGHIKVSNNTAAHEITFTFSKGQWAHASTGTALEIFWTAEIDGVNNKWDVPIDFTPRTSITTGSLVGDGTQYTYSMVVADSDTKLKNAVNTYRTPVRPQIDISLTGQNLVRRDLNEDQDFPYDWAVGKFSIANNGPTVAENMKYEFTFPASPQVRGVKIPCGGSNTTDYNVSATGLTSAGRTVNYTGTMQGYVYGSARITPVMLGLADNEYLVNLTIVQETLQVANFTNNRTTGQTVYYGKFINGQEGDVTLTISSDTPDGVMSNLPQTATSHTSIGWTTSGMGTIEVSASHEGYPSMETYTLPAGDQKGGSFFPGDPIYFDVNSNTGDSWSNSMHSNEITDPTFYINLPEGIGLDPASLQVLSAAGRNGPVFVPASVTGTPKTQIVDGIRWTSYRIQVNNKYDIIARNAQNEDYTGTLSDRYGGQNYFTLRFMAYVSLASAAYPSVSMADIVNIDLGRSALTASTSGFTGPDVNNWTGKTSSYGIAIAGNVNNISPGIPVVQDPGLNVSLGIRVFIDNNADGNNDNTEDFYSYNGTDVSIATVTGDHDAEIRIGYENTSADVYYPGSEIYLPIPKIGINYDHLFYNTVLQDAHLSEPGLAPHEPEWTAILEEEVVLPGFTTYYSIDTGAITEFTEGGIDDSWVPVKPQWDTYTNLLAAGHTLEEVTMLKFIASQDIAKVGDSGSKGETTFRISLEDGSVLGTLNFWRSYQKGWREADGSGTWLYGSVIAAETAMAGVLGKFFYDENRNGKLDAGEDNSTFLSQFTGSYKTMLLGTGIIGSPEMEIVGDGTFRSVAGNLYYFLREGNYTVRITNSDPSKWHITDVTPGTRSELVNNTPVWVNDIPQRQIEPDNTQAVFTFTVDENSINLQLVGIGIKAPPKVIPINPHIRLRLDR